MPDRGTALSAALCLVLAIAHDIFGARFSAFAIQRAAASRSVRSASSEVEAHYQSAIMAPCD
jgi:hypothetical protein